MADKQDEHGPPPPEGQEFDRFEQLTRGLLKVPKSEVDKSRIDNNSAQKPHRLSPAPVSRHAPVSRRMKSAISSPMSIAVAAGPRRGVVGKIDVSATRSPSTP